MQGFTSGLYGLLFLICIFCHSGIAVRRPACTKLPFPPSQNGVTTFIQKPFDYLILGGGTAGMALAGRLAEDPSLTIGVIEAGNFLWDDPLVNVPGLHFSTLGNPIYDWNFLTMPQSRAGNRNISFPRGKMLGGSSGLNFMAYGRASADEYDAWSKLSRNSNWSWTGFLPFFKKTENAATTDPFSSFERGDVSNSESSFTGFHGPISTSYNEFYSPDIPFYVQTLSGMGISVNSDPDNGNATGLCNSRVSVDRITGTRSYSAIGYYCQAAPQPNLHVLVGAQATRVLFRQGPFNLTAIGAEIMVGSKRFQVRSRKEVIISSGPAKTPQILELSGIGNRTILTRAGVRPLLDLPGVGENFQEHPFVGVEFKLRTGHQTFDILNNDPAFLQKQEALFNASGTGLLAALDSTLAFLPMQQIVSRNRLSNLTGLFDAEAQTAKNNSLRLLQYDIQKAWFAEGKVAHVELITWSRGTVDPAPNASYVSIIGGVLHPTSRGSVHISSNDPLLPPSLDAGFLENEFDAQALLDTVKFIQEIGQQPPFSNLVESQTAPNPSMQSDAALLDYIRNSVSGGGHMIGTASMAPREFGGVVDSSLKVYGTQNLRVVDASIFPIHIAAHIQATVYAVAEMAASIILSPKLN